MTLSRLWQLCDIAFNLEQKPERKAQVKYLAQLSDWLEQVHELCGNGVSDQELEVFVGLANMVHKGKGGEFGLIRSFYFVSMFIRARIKTYCEAHNIPLASILAVSAGAAKRVSGDVGFVHKKLPYKD